MKKRLINRGLLFILLLCSAIKLHAGTGVPVVQVLDGSLNQLAKDSTVMVMDSAFFNPDYSGLLIKPYRVLNNVTFKINESSPFFLQSDFTATVRLHITSTLVDNSTTSFDTSLTVNYRSDSIYTNRSIYHFESSYKVEVTVLSVSTNVGWNVWNALVVEDELQAFPLFTFSCTDNTIQSISGDALSYNTDADELPVSWGNIVEADEYDLEWTYVDSAALAAGLYNTGGNPDPALIFDNSASRVTITGTSYNIPLFYDGSGSLFFRVRPVQTPSPGIRTEADWSSDYTGGLGRFDYAGHQRNLNWQSTISFAEEGKRKVVVQYYDGSLRSRQTVTKDNTTNTTVVAESIYDYQGRPAIQVLPAPTLNNIVSYSANFNVGGINGLPYDQTSFDEMIDSSYYCTASADSMQSDSGAARYYSVKNPFRDSAFSQFIPNAGGYPFTETTFTPDNTGRIRSQGGVGPMYRITSGHETKYFYGSPDQRELDALFGTDAGDHMHYFKTMVEDANGQYSVSYADMHGRTVATALAGLLPDSIKLDSLKERVRIPITESLADSGSVIIKDLVMESKKSLLVSLAGNHTFTYSLNPQSLQKEDCNSTAVCYDCLYDLEITITDDCNNQKLPGGEPFDTVLHNFTVIDTTCANPAQGFSFSFTKYLPEGSYDITKKLSVSRSAMNYYRDSIFTRRNTCKSESSMIQEQKLIQAGILQCKPSCQNCNDSLGTFSTFQPRYMLNAGIAPADSADYRDQALTAYQQAQASCNLLCDSVSEADDKLAAMLLDLTPPTGQYANPDSAQDIYSIFHITYDNDSNVSQLAPYRLASGYVDESGKLDSVYDESTGTVVPPQELSPETFASKFKLSWAQALLPSHPEYCKLQKYQQWSASTRWDKRFASTDTYSAALAKGYLNATGITGSSYTRFNGVMGPIDPDPLPALIGGSFLSVFQNELKNYNGVGTNAPTPIVGGIWNLAAVKIKCGQNSACFYRNQNIDSAFANMCTGDLDMAWRNFRQMYLDTKRHMTDSVLNHVLCTGSISSTTLIAAYHQPNFSDVQQSISNYDMYIPSSYSDTITAKQNAKNAAAGSYNFNCASYATYWYQQLGQCGYTSTDSANIIPLLIQVCQKGSDLTHPYGSSSISPDSTNTYQTFEDVIEAYNTAHSISNMYCNAYGITSPKPYNNQSAYGNLPLYGKPDNCTCDRITDLYYRYRAVQASYSSFSDYLLQVYNTTMTTTDLNTLLSECSLLNTVATCSYSSSPIQLPPVLQCNTGDVCITCEQFKTYNDKFKALYPSVTPVADSLASDTTQLNINKLYAAYMNNQFGFVESCNDYMQFASTCASRLAQDSLNDISDTCKRYTYIKNYGGSGVDQIMDAHQTLDGGYILAGNTTSFGNGGTDGYLIKTDAKGNIQWSKTYGGAGNDDFRKVRQTADSGYVAVGSTKSYHRSQGELYVVKMKPDGSVTWADGLYQTTTYGDFGYDIIQTSDHGYAVTGLWNFASGVDDIEVVKLNSSGAVTWGKKFGSTSSDNLGGIVEKADTLFLGGFVYSSAVTKVGGGSPPYSYYDALLCKIDRNNGNIVWAKTYNINNKSNWVFSMTNTANGYRLTTFDADSYSNNNPTQIGFDLDRSGNPIRARQMTVATTDISSCVSSPTADGGYIFSQGYYDNTFGDPYLHKVDASGNVTWTNRIQKTGLQYLTQILQSNDSSFVGAGIDGNHGLFLKTSRWGKTYCNDASLNYPGTLLSTIPYDITLTPTTLSFASPAITVIGYNAQTTQTDFCSLNPCTTPSGAGPTLCGRSAPVFPSVLLDSITNCSDSTFFAVSAGTELYNSYKDSINNDFDTAYRNLCMQAYKYESFTVTHEASEYHYTLYYYDQAGNLIRTIPPAGVDVSKFGWIDAWSDSVSYARTHNISRTPDHVLTTDYRYNTLNQVLAQRSPDGGRSRFWYDRLGRLALSQNANQRTISGTETGRRYSYSLYDYIGRITEVGQISNVGSTAMTDSISRRQSLLDSWLSASAANKEQITQTVYDIPYTGFTGIDPQPVYQRNLRNRVSYTTITSGANPAQYNQGSFYTYDALGNVDTLLQDYGASDVTPAQNVMNMNDNRFKKIVYQFDLVSGKVNWVGYQPNQADQFYHRYIYDAENRLILAETSTDSVIWEKEARYQYYKHGPLARTVIGDQQVQGIDYAYTLQGWIKGANSSSLANGIDMGRDGDTTWINRYVARDAYGFNLGYYTGDYTSIGSTATPFPGYSGLIGTGYKPLFNGNISSMVVNIGKFNNPLLYMYTYDQLNRLTGMDVDSGFNQLTNTWNTTPSSIQDYKERVSYDPNGNIMRYLRNGTNSVNLVMDSLSYFYNRDGNGRLLNNQLNYIRDEIGGSSAHSSNYPNDIDNQSVNNYAYDSIGNLVSDNAEGITSITWNVYGKIKEIQRTATGSNPTTDIQYTYDASGNRISKKVTDNSGNVTYTWYSRDGQGNVFSIYTGKGTGSTLTSYSLSLSELLLYGSSRIGILNCLTDMKSTFTPQGIITFQRGYKSYELPNHLSNVLVTVSDKKNGVSSNGITIDNYLADIKSALDYFPFGMQQPGRVFAASDSYRYGFNGKENDDDAKGMGNQIDFDTRILDPRSGRFLSVDPLSKNYSDMSNYSFSRNSPIYRMDLDGEWDITVHAYNDRKKYGYGIAIVTDRHGNEVFRFKVRLQGTGGANRMLANSDTPEGIYDIPNGSNKWISGGSRLSYGPNPRLSLSGLSGEIAESGRTSIRIHGGRQETPIRNGNGEIIGWEPISDAELKKTHGCLRVYDTDIKTLKDITDKLEANDKEEVGGQVTIVANLLLDKNGEPIPPAMKPRLLTKNPDKNEGQPNGTEHEAKQGILDRIKSFIQRYNPFENSGGKLIDSKPRVNSSDNQNQPNKT